MLSSPNRPQLTHSSSPELPAGDRTTADPSRSLSRISIGGWILLSVMMIGALFGRVSYLVKTADPDARLFIYLGKLVAEGGRFGHDLMDNKFPTVGLAFSVFWRTLGNNWPAYVWLQTAMSIVESILLGRMAKRRFGAYAMLPTALYAMVFLNFNVAVFGGFQLEGLHAFFAILGAGAALEALNEESASDAFVVGLAAGYAAMFKPTGLAILAAFAGATLVRFARHPRVIIKHGGAAAIGLSLPAIVTLAHLVHTDILRDMPALYRQISRYAAETPLTFADCLKPLVVLAILGFPLLIRARVFRRDRLDSNARVSVTLSMVIFVSAWFILELAGAVGQKRMCGYHFFVIGPPAALLFGMIPRSPRLTPLIAGLLPIVILSDWAACNVIKDYWPVQPRLQASEYLIAHTQPGDRVWQDSMARLLLETNLQPGSRIPLAYLFFNWDDAPQEYSAIMLHDFEVRRPKYILLPEKLDWWLERKDALAAFEPGLKARRINYRAAWVDIAAYVHAHYTAETNLEGETVYRRLEAPAANSH